MINQHETKCLCGNGTVHFHRDTDGHTYRKLDCPECARKYHVTPRGLLPRHIPLKYPNSPLVKRIKLKEYMVGHLNQCQYEDLIPFLTEEEKLAIYGPNPTELSPLVFAENADRTTKRNLYAMSMWACQYPKMDLLFIHDGIVDHIYRAQTKQFLQRYGHFREEELVKLLERTILDYEKHMECQQRMKAREEQTRNELAALYQQRREECARIDEMRKQCLIPWTQLEPIE